MHDTGKWKGPSKKEWTPKLTRSNEPVRTIYACCLFTSYYPAAINIFYLCDVFYFRFYVTHCLIRLVFPVEKADVASCEKFETRLDYYYALSSTSGTTARFPRLIL